MARASFAYVDTEGFLVTLSDRQLTVMDLSRKVLRKIPVDVPISHFGGMSLHRGKRRFPTTLQQRRRFTTSRLGRKSALLTFNPPPIDRPSLTGTSNPTCQSTASTMKLWLLRTTKAPRSASCFASELQVVTSISNRISIWECGKKYPVQTFPGKTDVNCIFVDTYKFLCGTSKGVEIWDFTGKSLELNDSQTKRVEEDHPLGGPSCCHSAVWNNGRSRVELGLFQAGLCEAEGGHMR